MAKPRAAAQVSLRFVEELIARHLELKREIEELQREQARLDEQLRIALELSPGKRADTAVGTAALVESDVMGYDLEALQERVPPDLLERLTRRVVEKRAVEAAVSLGLLAPEVADAARRRIKRKPQLRVSPR